MALSPINMFILNGNHFSFYVTIPRVLLDIFRNTGFLKPYLDLGTFYQRCCICLSQLQLKYGVQKCWWSLPLCNCTCIPLFTSTLCIHFPEFPKNQKALCGQTKKVWLFIFLSPKTKAPLSVSSSHSYSYWFNRKQLKS